MSRKSYLTKLINDNDSDAVVYCIGLVSVFLVAAVYFIIRMSHIIPDTGCAFRRITGLYCPGCGGTRSFVYLIHGHIIKSLAYHPFVPYVFTIAIIFTFHRPCVSSRKAVHGRCILACPLLYRVLLSSCLTGLSEIFFSLRG